MKSGDQGCLAGKAFFERRRPGRRSIAERRRTDAPLPERTFRHQLWGAPEGLLIPQADRLLICSSYQSRNDLDMFGPPDKVVPCETWGEAMIPLLNAYPNSAKVAVYPYAAIQCPVED